MDRFTKAAITEHLDHIARLKARAEEARAMGVPGIAAGAWEDIERRRSQIRKLKEPTPMAGNG